MHLKYLENLKPEEIIIYLRKSRADDPMLSIEEVLSKHEALLDEWAEKNLSAPIPQENRFKEVVSGESIADRPEFQKVLKLLESPKIKAVLVVEISRLGRPDTEEIGRITKIFRYTSCLVITPMMTFDIANEYERDMFERELKRGNEYLEYTKKLLSRGRELSVKSGNYICSKPPYGYDKITIIENKKKCPTLAINEAQAEVVRMIFNWYTSENIGTQKVADRLNEMGIAPAEKKLWSSEAIRDMLENPVYIGKVRWNTRKAVHVVEDGMIRKTRPVSDDFIICEGKHEAIISEELFQAAREKRGRAHRTCANNDLKNPLASILRCECGRPMVYINSTRNKKPKGDPKLKCNGQKYCGNGSCTVDEILPFVADVLKAKIEEFELEAKNGNEETIKAQERLIKNLEKKLADIGTRELSLWESQVDPDLANRMPSHIFQALTDKLNKERKETETSLTKARKAMVTPVNYEKMIVTFRNAYDALLDEKKSVAEKNHLLKACIRRVTYHRDAVERATGKGSANKRIYPPIEVKIELWV